MTIKELLKCINEMAMLDDNFLDFKVMMTGHNDGGYRQHNIPAKDVTYNFEDKVLRIWDT
jgi:hypothetical protein